MGHLRCPRVPAEPSSDGSRWAADKTTSKKDAERLLALAVLDAIDRSKPAMLQAEDQGILDAVLATTLEDVTAVVEGVPLTTAVTTRRRWPQTMVDRRVPGRDETFVSPSEVKAAQMMVRRMLGRGEEPSRALLAIANARGDFDVDILRSTV